MTAAPSLPSLATIVRDHARRKGAAPAFIEPGRQIDWAGYDALTDRWAMRLLAAGVEPGERVAVYLPDGIGLHAGLLAAEKAGVIALGIGARAGLREVRHLIKVSGASTLLSLAHHRDQDMGAVYTDLADEGTALRRHLTVEEAEVDDHRRAPGAADVLSGLSLGADDLFLLNSTSGTTGMPKCVAHDQARWYAFHREAVEAAALSSDDVLMSVAPPPFGFGIWTSHVTPTVLGAPVVIMPRFDASEALALIARHKVSVLAAVSTQFIMMLERPEFSTTNFSSLRVLFTGGEMVPYPRAKRFEEETGAAVLQFYGSNETGAFSRTTLDDSVDHRLTTAGRLIERMDVRLFDDDGADVTASGRGRPGGRGPILSRGYYNDAAANAQLYTADGYMLMEDIVTIDGDGYLTVVGRKGDFVIRGGKNISCAAVEEAAAGHPAVALAAAIGAPDPVFGERVMLFITTRDGAALALADLTAHMAARQVSRELFPEYLVVRPELPRSSGDKIAKQVLREEAKRLVAGSKAE